MATVQRETNMPNMQNIPPLPTIKEFISAIVGQETRGSAAYVQEFRYLIDTYVISSAHDYQLSIGEMRNVLTAFTKYVQSEYEEGRMTDAAHDKYRVNMSLLRRKYKFFNRRENGTYVEYFGGPERLGGRRSKRSHRKTRKHRSKGGRRGKSRKH